MTASLNSRKQLASTEPPTKVAVQGGWVGGKNYSVVNSTEAQGRMVAWAQTFTYKRGTTRSLHVTGLTGTFVESRS